jgi:transcriptional regulator with XRE-family HTH domain
MAKRNNYGRLQKVGKRLAKWRADSGRPQFECAAEAGVPQSTWSDWERGVRCPTGEQATGIERVTAGHVRAAEWAATREDVVKKRAA